MATLRRLLEKTIELNEIITTTTSEVIDLDGAQSISVQCVVDVTTPAAKQFDSGESQVTTITFDTKANTSAGDYVVIYDTAGLAWAVAADLDGDDAEPTGATWVSIPASRKAQVNLSAATSAAEVAAAFETAFDGLAGVPFATDDSENDGTMEITVTLRGPTLEAVTFNADDTGPGSITVNTDNEGVAPEVNVADNELSIPSHGFFTGLIGQLTTTGTLPGNLSTGTDYYVIVVDDNTIKLASSLANALAGTAVDIGDQGTDGSVNTFTPTAIAGASVKLEKSNDPSLTKWNDVASASSITQDGTIWIEKDAPNFRYARLTYTLTAGSMSTSNHVLVKGTQT